MDLMAWVNQYGYVVLFIALMLELVAVPLPGELLMSYAGFLVFQGRLGWLPGIITAAAGASAGITLSYLAGKKLGYPFFHRHGHRVHLAPEQLDRMSVWFQRYGNRMLLFAYFVPGIRHITGYFSGITGISYRRFGLNASLGAVFWASTFISLGRALGPQWEQFHTSVKNYLLVGSLIAILTGLLIYLYKTRKTQLLEMFFGWLERGFRIFHSMGRVRVLVALAAVAFFGLTLLLFGMIQDYLAHEFGQFNEIAAFLTHLLFNRAWQNPMEVFGWLSSVPVLAGVAGAAWLRIIFIRRNPFLESVFLVITMAGGIGVGLIVPAFLSGQTLMAGTTWGFMAFMLTRHTTSRAVRSAAPIAAVMSALLNGLSQVYFGPEEPSTVAAGLVFGGIWLSLNMILLEVFRVLNHAELPEIGRRIKK